MNVLELYSGIGGMHMALKASDCKGTIMASIDINTTANIIYKHNFPETKLLNRNVQSLEATKFIKLQAVDTILMSPPCQPFTRNGNRNDMNDARTESFLYILQLLPKLTNIKRILIENVKGFELSNMCNVLRETLSNCEFKVQEFILSPIEFGVPNSRSRYYCLARRNCGDFSFETTKELMTQFPIRIAGNSACYKIGDIVEKPGEANLTPYLIADKILIKRAKILDVCDLNSRRSCCFTKAYGRYVEGTGSVLTVDKTLQEVNEIFKNINFTEENLQLLQSLRLRYFTPTEICRLMSFPKYFSFPDGITDRQKYNVLGNSINVKVVAELIKLLQ